MMLLNRPFGFLLLAIALALYAAPARAGLAETDLEQVSFTPAPGASLPLELTFRNAAGHDETLAAALAGKPALVLPLDYGCRLTCGPALAIIAGALAETGLRPGRDFRLVLIGLDPNTNEADARAFTKARIGETDLASATAVLTGKPNVLQTAMGALGYRYTYDAGNGAFAHPTGLIAITAEGRIARGLSSLAVNATDLRLALIEAGEGKIGGLLGRVSLLCYGFDAVHGIYTGSILRILNFAAVLSVLLLAGAVAYLSWRTRLQRGQA